MNPTNLLVFFVLLSLMMVLHELGHFVTARMAKITVQEFGIGLPPRAIGFPFRGVIYSLNWIPFGAFVKMLGEEDPSAPGSFASKPKRVRAIVLAAGSGMNYLLAVVAFTSAALVGVPTPTQDGPVRLVAIAPASPAESAGLRQNDLVVQFNGQPVTSGQQFRDLTSQNLGQPVELTVRRGQEEVRTSLTPRANPPEGQGAIGVGLGVSTVIKQFPLQEAIGQGFQQAWRAVTLTLAIPGMLMGGIITPEEARPVGLVGMAQITSDAVDQSAYAGVWYPVLILLGTFSAGLALANMLPIPALDGGRLFFILVEAVRGRRIAPEREAAFHFAGIVLLLSLMVAISINDIVSPLPSVNWGLR